MQSLSARQPFQAATAAPARVAARGQRSVVVSVKPTKAADFRGLSDEELMTKLGNLKTEMASVRFLQRTRGVAEFSGETMPQPDPEKTPKANLNKHIRRQIAQLWTIWRERQIKEGVNSRESRKMQVRSSLGLFPRQSGRQ